MSGLISETLRNALFLKCGKGNEKVKPNLLGLPLTGLEPDLAPATEPVGT